MKAFSYRQRVGLLGIGVGCGCVLLLSRLFVLQVVDHEVWTEQALRLRSTWRPVAAVRGPILDARGRVLAHDAAGFELAVLALAWERQRYQCLRCDAVHFVARGAKPPHRCRRCRGRRIDAKGKRWIVAADRRDLGPVARLLKMPPDELRARIEKRVAGVEQAIDRKLVGLAGKKRRAKAKEFWFDYGRRPKRIRRDVPYAVAREVALHPDRNPAFRIQTSHSRQYPGGAAFAHLLGRLGEAEKPAIVFRAGLSRKMVTHVGASGLEYHFERQLRGTAGWVEVERDLRLQSRRIVGERAAQPGQTIRLTIDARDQERAAQALSHAQGAFVVIHAATGAVLALATSPSYDPAHYPATVAQWLQREKQRGGAVLHGSPLIDRSFRSYHTPGSIMKPFTAVAALRSGDGHLDEVIHCEKVFTFKGKRMLDRLRCNAIHGDLDMHRALAISCNVYFQTLLARMLEHEHFPGFAETGRLFGFGRPTGIEIQSTTSKRKTGRWEFAGERHPGVLIASAIGQGKVLVSPAQMARAYAGIATGYLPRLHLVARVGGRATPTSRERLPFRESILEGVRSALRDVARAGGSAPAYGLARYDIACKTGTAQISNTGSAIYNAWMVGFAPARGARPPIAFAMVVLRSPLGGAHACGPRLEEFFRYFYDGGSQ